MISEVVSSGSAIPMIPGLRMPKIISHNDSSNN